MDIQEKNSNNETPLKDLEYFVESEEEQEYIVQLIRLLCAGYDELEPRLKDLVYDLLLFFIPIPQWNLESPSERDIQASINTCIHVFTGMLKAKWTGMTLLENFEKFECKLEPFANFVLHSTVVDLHKKAPDAIDPSCAIYIDITKEVAIFRFVPPEDESTREIAIQNYKITFEQNCHTIAQILARYELPLGDEVQLAHVAALLQFVLVGTKAFAEVLAREIPAYSGNDYHNAAFRYLLSDAVLGDKTSVERLLDICKELFATNTF